MIVERAQNQNCAPLETKVIQSFHKQDVRGDFEFGVGFNQNNDLVYFYLIDIKANKV